MRIRFLFLSVLNFTSRIIFKLLSHRRSIFWSGFLHSPRSSHVKIHHSATSRIILHLLSSLKELLFLVVCEWPGPQECQAPAPSGTWSMLWAPFQLRWNRSHIRWHTTPYTLNPKTNTYALESVAGIFTSLNSGLFVGSACQHCFISVEIISGM